MIKKYRVLPCEVSEGIEKLSEPIPRRIYGPGEIIELDDAVSDVAGIMARGQIEEIIEVAEVAIEEAPAPAKKSKQSD